MKETQALIKQYQARLPHMREKLAMAVMLFVISAVMLTSATFAWIVLSRNPEVTNISTTITGNGSLEVALSDLDGLEPDMSQVGDSTAAGKSIKEANLTWGNLVNVSDGYGLDNLTLRPARLNINGLKTGNPLWGAVYGRDGRIEALESDFAYTVWQEASEGNAAAFVVPVGSAYGVRAISSVTYKNLSGDTTFRELCDTAGSLNEVAGAAYLALTGNQYYMDSIAGLMCTFIETKVGGSASADCSEYVESVYQMMEEFYDVMGKAGDALAYLANTQQFLKQGANYVPYTRDSLLSASEAELTEKGVSLASLAQYKSDYTQLAKDIVTMEKHYVAVRDSSAVVTWTQLSPIINRLVDINSCTVDDLKVSDIDMNTAMDLMGGGIKQAVIHKGFLYNLEKLTGSNMFVQEMSLTVHVNMAFINRDVTMTADIYTDLKDTGTSTFYNDLSAIKEANKGDYVGGDAVAQDTYGMALDIWVRTNAEGGYLLLNGNVITQDEQEKVTGHITNAAGELETVDLYTYKTTVQDAEGNEIGLEYDLYQKDGKWYSYDNHTEIEVTGTPQQKIKVNKTVIDFKGDNRVWENNGLLTEDSTTQGSGSCYVYYADTPEDSARSLELLKSMKVAFISSGDTLLATATMDTENCYSMSGKYIVPLVVSESNHIATDEFGSSVKAITPLVQGEATRITAILYLDGTTLTNDEVLSVADIQGTLNLQFGSSVPLETIGDDKLEEATVAITASVDDTSFDYDNDTDLTAGVTVNVSGFTPQRVEARFQRAINASQGTRMEKFTFQSTGNEGEWTGDYTFNAPGNYILRFIMLDGIEYELDAPIIVNVEGFNLTSLTCDRSEIMTADRSADVNLSLTFATNDVEKMPRTVQGRFMDEGGNSTTINFTRNTTTNVWSGSGKFVSSGVYTLQYLVLDGQYTEVPAELQRQVDVRLGMKTRVYVRRTGEDTSLNFKYYSSETLEVSAIVMDDGNQEMQGLQGLRLFYGKEGSALQESGMNADLTWNPSTGRYEGQFQLTGAGIYNFSSLIVNGNIITVATNAPTVRAQSPEPPKYLGAVGVQDYQFAPNNDATLNVRVSYSSSATGMKAVFIKDGNIAKKYTVDATMGTETNVDGVSVNNWIIPYPKDGDTQDGTWTLKEIHMAGVYDAASKEYTEDDPMILAATDEPVTKLVATVVVRFAEGQSKELGGTADKITGYFMQGHEVNGLNVTISDKTGAPLQAVTDVTLTYKHKVGTEDTYGYYTSDYLDGTTPEENISITLAGTGADSTNFVQQEAVTFRVAGEYLCSFSFSVNGRPYTYGSGSDLALPENAPQFTVRSMKPTLTITGTDPKGGTLDNPNGGAKFNVNVASDSSGGSSPVSGVQNYYSDYLANVYIKYTNGALSKYELPKVTMKLTNAGSAFTKATALVKNGESEDYNRTYTFTEDNSSQSQSIGGYMNVLVAHNRYLGQTQKVSTITMTYGGKDYTVDLSNAVTIKQNQNPPYITFVDVDTSKGGNTTPANIVSPDGNSMKVKLPTMKDWTETEIIAGEGNGEVQTNSTTTDVCTSYTEGSGCNKKTLYNYYTRTVRTTEEVTLQETYTVSYTIKWKIGSKTYDQGAEITVSAGQTATAVIVETGRTLTNSEMKTCTRKYTLDTAGATGQSSKKGDVVTTLYTTETMTSETW